MVWIPLLKGLGIVHIVASRVDAGALREVQVRFGDLFRKTEAQAVSCHARLAMYFCDREVAFVLDDSSVLYDGSIFAVSYTHLTLPTIYSV